ncbi:MAG: UDP-2,4-diacetamido-2,4,6-trideoxy-beta-L-altropyranose hydrolase [Oscillibacter sp.]|nr:UDP-2,4-diacetamido-2,4,6-trideoxy-beta-L-altropyranose hydrolase [Oscillibacter sp.]
MVFFRVDGNFQIGTGHIMRCLSLADAFQEEGVRSVFVMAEAYMRPLIQERGHECRVLSSAYDRMEEELPAFLPLVEEERPSFVVLDSYFVTLKYMNAVRAKTPLVYIDDLNAFDYPSDAVVNYNLYEKTMAYPPDKTYFLGPQYAPLRKQFQGLAFRAARERVKQIFFSTGGTDPHHVALRCVEYLLAHPSAQSGTYHVVLGTMNQDVEQIKEKTARASCIVLHQQVRDMCALMLQCDAAISAAGTTLYELCACGLPTVTYILADNQIGGAAAFDKAGLMTCAGDVRTAPDFVENVFLKLDGLQNQALRQRIARRMQTLVDGNGAVRLANRLQVLIGGSCK